MFSTQKSGFEVDLAHARKHSLLQGDLGEVGDIPAEGQLAVRTALGVVEPRGTRRRAALRKSVGEEMITGIV